ncbi:MAG: putative formyltransferase [Candidatus Saccharibacteria bacterium]|nr:putative formyltransferase [Candidatus Saccharibacteria bacterium]
MVNERILVVTDNKEILDFFVKLLKEKKDLLGKRTIRFACHPNSALLKSGTQDIEIIPVDMKKQVGEVIKNYDLVISAHCKQIFPAELVEKVKCINIHPGFNPYNRGWFPQVFSILNGLTLGATIHEIDEAIDHGNIIAQKEVPLYAWDTSLTAYQRVQEAEKELLKENLHSILSNTYTTFVPKAEGNLNLKVDFDKLCEIDMNEQTSFQETIDKLRALTHPPYKNAYFIDPKSGEKVWIQINLEKDSQ